MAAATVVEPRRGIDGDCRALDDNFDYIDDDGHLMPASQQHTVAAAGLAAALQRVLELQALPASFNWEIFVDLDDARSRFGPHVFVVLRIAPFFGTSFQVGATGPTPVLAVELASPATWEHHQGEKLRRYEAAGIDTYVVYDLPGDLWPGERLRAWRLRDGVYLPATSRAVAGERRWHVGPLDIWLASGDDEVLVYDRHGDLVLAGGRWARQEEELRQAEQQRRQAA